MHHFILHQPRGFNTVERMLVTLLAFGVTILLAYLSWIYFEKPLVALGHRHQYISKQEASPAAVEVAVPTAAEV
jgi:peptidoglycan/LPS O-acetylase OafA/YrhL